MNARSFAQEAMAISISVLFLALGFLTIWVTKAALNIEADAVFVSLLLVPIVVYLIFSGRLKEIRAPGGLEAKFADAAQDSIEATAETIEASVEEMQVIAKGGLSELQKSVQHIDQSKPIIMTVTLGKQGYYDRWAASQYVKALSQYRNFKFVVIVDQNANFVAYMPAWMVTQILELDQLGSEFVQVINEGRIQDLRRYPGVVTKTILTKATNKQALQEMMSQNLEALVVIDEEHKLRGVVEREQILSRLMLALAK